MKKKHTHTKRRPKGIWQTCAKDERKREEGKKTQLLVHKVNLGTKGK